MQSRCSSYPRRSPPGLWSLQLLSLLLLVGSPGAHLQASEGPAAPACQETQGSLCGALELGAGDRESGDPAAILALDDALRLAVLKSPELEWLSLEKRSRELAIGQARRRPNPELSVEVENLRMDEGSDGLTDSEATLAMRFLIERGEKAQRRSALARSERALVEWDYASKRLEVLEHTATAFVEVMAAQERLALAHELTTLAAAEQVELARRVSSGASSRLDANQVEISVATSRLEEHLAERELVKARAELAATWGSHSPDFAAVDGDFWSLHLPPSWKSLEEQAGSIPDVQRWETERERRQAELSLAESEAVPDLEFQAGFRRLGDENENALVFEMSTPLMLFDRSRVAIERSRLALLQERSERAMARKHVRRDLVDAYETISARYDEARSLEEEILPLARSGFERARAAYRTGRLRYVEVVEAQRRLFEVREQQIETLVEYHKGRVALDRVLGTLGDASHSIHLPAVQ